jgi:hypothetical protein
VTASIDEQARIAQLEAQLAELRDKISGVRLLLTILRCIALQVLEGEERKTLQ